MAEALLWAGGRACGYCGTLEASTPLKGREGYYQCKACRKQFTVMVGTVFERSHIPLNKWLQAAFIMSASKKGMSAHPDEPHAGHHLQVDVVHVPPPA